VTGMSKCLSVRTAPGNLGCNTVLHWGITITLTHQIISLNLINEANLLIHWLIYLHACFGWSFGVCKCLCNFWISWFPQMECYNSCGWISFLVNSALLIVMCRPFWVSLHGYQAKGLSSPCYGVLECYGRLFRNRAPDKSNKQCMLR